MTNWCPDREEHGFMYVPLFKCSTNPRALSAHRWNTVDAVGRMSKPTGTFRVSSLGHTSHMCAECFYHQDGTWYYAGTYKAFLIDVAPPMEWELLTTEVRPSSSLSRSVN